MARAELHSISPSFIVTDVARTSAFYCDKLGFELRFQAPDIDPFMALLGRDGVQIFIKAEDGIAPQPNPTRHPHLRWDAYVYVQDPDTLAAEFAADGVVFSTPLENNSDHLRGFELQDPDGYTIFFGRPN